MVLLVILAVASLSSCQKLKPSLQESSVQTNEESIMQDESSVSGQIAADNTTEEQQEKLADTVFDEQAQQMEEPEILNFVDVFGESYQVEIKPEVKKHSYQMEAFVHDGHKLTYEGDSNYRCRLGVDVSHHNGDINWEKVREAGYEFAFLRIGYRGYGQAGSVCLDRKFLQNIQYAKAAGIDVGVYFFSQAVNEEEAEEEAAFVLKNLEGYDLQLPVVYDPESILDAEARTDDVSGKQFTKNTIVFCRKIAKAGYQPMIYSNMLWEAYQFELEKLSEYPVWYADYEKLPQTPYAFEYWQYSNEGIVDGIAGAVDLDIQLIDNKEKK